MSEGAITEHLAEALKEAVEMVERLQAERDEAVAALALYRLENGCTRGQYTTQWCGEAVRLRESLETVKRMLDFLDQPFAPWFKGRTVVIDAIAVAREALSGKRPG
jgi:hypothetical protein